jgi:pyridoxine 5'-phosphate synthase PdxJ
MESLIQFQHLQPTRFHGSTAVWRIELASHETKKLGYRLNMFTDNQPSSTISAASTLAQAKAAELKDEAAAKLEDLKAQASHKLDDLKKAATDTLNKFKG